MNKRRIFLAGDSTVAYNDISTYPQAGWGQMIHLYLQDDIEVINHAKNGRSSKSFITEERLDKIDQEISEGDFLFIQFGHNDQKEDEERRTEPYTSYQEHLTKYIEVARAHQAVPVLVTSLYRRHFDENGMLKDQVHGEYPNAMKDLAEKLNVPCIDLCEKSRVFLAELGDAESKKLFMNLAPNEYVSCIEGKEDNTHLKHEGALKIAGLVAEGIKELGEDFAKLIKY